MGGTKIGITVCHGGWGFGICWPGSEGIADLGIWGNKNYCCQLAWSAALVINHKHPEDTWVRQNSAYHSAMVCLGVWVLLADWSKKLGIWESDNETVMVMFRTRD